MKSIKYSTLIICAIFSSLYSHYAEIIIALDTALQENGTLGEMFQLDSLLEIIKEYEETKHQYSQSENLVIQTAFDRIMLVLLATKTCAASVSPEMPLILPTTSPSAQYQVLDNVNITTGQLGWITTVTDSGQLNLLATATSYDIPLTLVLRDSTGSFAATTVRVQSLVITPTATQGCIIFTDSASNTIGNICVNQQAMILAPVPPRALQATNDTLARGVSAIDLQMSKTSNTQIASGNYSVIAGGQNNSASGAYSVIAGGLSNTITNTLSAIAGGSTNTISGYNSFIGAGFANTVTGNYSAIVSGTGNFIGNDFSVIVAGQSNIITNSNCFIGAGSNNIISQLSSGILAGQINTVTTNNFAFIGAGQFNAALGIASGILTGSSNTTSNSETTCVAGQSNTLSGQQAFVGAGRLNIALATCCNVLAGASNSSRSNFDAILTGIGNFTGGAVSSFMGAGLFNTGSATHAIITGSNNTVTQSGGSGAITAGQSNSAGFQSFCGAGVSNNANNTNQTILSGINNRGASQSVIMGGQSNQAAATSFTGAGIFNTIPGGIECVILTGSGNATTGGSTIIATIISGQLNTSFQAFISGGYFNRSIANGLYSGILSGSGNTISQNLCTILGGRNNNCTGVNALAAGTNGSSSRGSFLWTDNNTGSISLGATNNQFVVRASGGSYIYTSTAGNIKGPGVQLAPGGGAWNNLSDKNLKNNFKSIDHISITTSLSDLPITEWNYSTQDPSIIHIGPMAQDFNTLYGYGEYQKYINTSDAIGILFSSLHGLYSLHKKTFNQYENYYTKIESLKKRIATLKK